MKKAHYGNSLFIEAVVHWCSVKKVFLEITQNSLENICARVNHTPKFSFLTYSELARAYQLRNKKGHLLIC